MKSVGYTPSVESFGVSLLATTHYEDDRVNGAGGTVMGAQQMPEWQKLVNRFLRWLKTPWKVTATALAGLVVWYILPILQALAEEVLRALENPNAEPDSWLKPIATFAHRALFVEVIVFCEIVLVGAIVLVATKFIFGIANYIVKMLRQWRRTRRESTPSTHSAGQLLTLPKRKPDDGKAAS